MMQVVYHFTAWYWCMILIACVIPAAVHMVWLPGAETWTEVLKSWCECFVFCAVEPLYDWSGRTVSAHEQQMMRHFQITFRHLITIFEDFCSCSSTATESGDHSYTVTCALADEIFVFVVNDWIFMGLKLNVDTFLILQSDDALEV